MLEIKLKSPDDFLKIKETLTRMGIANNAEKVLYQSCHIYAHRGKYYIAHFKELLKLDGLVAEMSEEDVIRRNNIAKMLAEWNMCELTGTHQFGEHNAFRVISYSEKPSWKLVTKYSY